MPCPFCLLPYLVLVCVPESAGIGVGVGAIIAGQVATSATVIPPTSVLILICISARVV